MSREISAFFKAFLQNPVAVGSVLPSSQITAKAMLKNVYPSENAIILELGCGTGAFTSAIEKVLPSENCYLGIEINCDLVKILENRFPDLKVVCGNADAAREIHQNSGLGEVGYVISALPFGSLPDTVRKNVLTEIDKFMRPGCIFRTIQYASSLPFPPARSFRREMEMRYGKTEFSPLIWRNFPPVYTLTWQIWDQFETFFE